jgi:protein gp37
VSPGCEHCYAETLAARFSKPGLPFHGVVERKASGPHWTGKIELLESTLLDPLSWKKPAKVFVNSMSDLFHPDVPELFIRKVFKVMEMTPSHTYQILTKRPERMQEIVSSIQPTPLSNVWLGTSVEDRQRLARIGALAHTPAIVRFLSLEPLLEDLRNFPLFNIGWVIIGGESGRQARPCNLSWIRSIIHHCQEVGIPVFVKQLGSCPVEMVNLGQGFLPTPITHKQGANPLEWPVDLQVQEFPTQWQ